MPMHVVIMGCGRVGSLLAIELEANGHSVAVIDQAKEAFRRLGPDFKGRTITGVGFDRDTLLEAGIEGADAFAAVSNGDNSNILAARVARESYGVTNVVARIYDPGRAGDLSAPWHSNCCNSYLGYRSDPASTYPRRFSL